SSPERLPSPISQPASSTNFCPFSRATLPSLNLPTRIFGPCRSHRIATVRPSLEAISLTSFARFSWSCAVPCEKLSRTTSTPARTMRSSTAGSLDAGPRVATIFVLRSMKDVLTILADSPALDDRLPFFVARLEKDLVAASRRVHRERARHRHHAGEAAAHSLQFDLQLFENLRDGKRQRGGAVQDDARQPGSPGVFRVGVDRVPDARALGVDMPGRRGDGKGPDQRQVSFKRPRILDRSGAAIAAVEHHPAIQHAVVARAHGLALFVPRLEAKNDQRPRLALQARDD